MSSGGRRLAAGGGSAELGEGRRGLSGTPRSSRRPTCQRERPGRGARPARWVARAPRRCLAVRAQQAFSCRETWVAGGTAAPRQPRCASERSAGKRRRGPAPGRWVPAPGPAESRTDARPAGSFCRCSPGGPRSLSLSLLPLLLSFLSLSRGRGVGVRGRTELRASLRFPGVALFRRLFPSPVLETQQRLKEK